MKRVIEGAAATLAAAVIAGRARAQDALELGDDIRDIRGPMFEPAPFWAGLEGWAVAALALVAAAVAGWLVYRWLHRPKDARAVALARIDRARALADRGAAKALAVELSEAVRGYLEARFEVHAPQRTTEELLAELAADPDSPLAAHREALAEFLGACDGAKFGGFEYGLELLDSMHGAARALVERTWEPEPQPAAGSRAAMGGAA